MNLPPDDTIVALATPPGRGGLAVVRLAGPGASRVAARLIEGGRVPEPRCATLVHVAGRPLEGSHGAAVLDEAIVTYFAAPASYTGDDVVELSVHGSPAVAAAVIDAAIAAGARPAGRGEFTLRAFLNGRLDLTRAEAVQDLVEAATPVQARMAFDQLQGTLAERLGEIERALFDLTARLEASGDFPDEGYHFITPEETREAMRAALARMESLLAESKRGRLLREGITVAICGRPNVGKSTLFNRLLGVERAIVTAVPGTTRDLLTEVVTFGGTTLTLVDTAGLRPTIDEVEREGVARAERASAAAAIVLVVLDGSTPLGAEDFSLLEATRGRPRLVAANKSDLPPAWDARDSRDLSEAVQVSATTGAGIDALIRAINRITDLDVEVEPPAISNIRHIRLLAKAARATRRAIEAEGETIGQTPEELILADLRVALESLQEVTGKRTTDDLLRAIFSRFCVGK